MIAATCQFVDLSQPEDARVAGCVLTCSSCGTEEDLYASEPLCCECRSPLTTLAFPDDYFDAGGEG